MASVGRRTAQSPRVVTSCADEPVAARAGSRGGTGERPASRSASTASAVSQTGDWHASSRRPSSSSIVKVSRPCERLRASPGGRARSRARAARRSTRPTAAGCRPTIRRAPAARRSSARGPERAPAERRRAGRRRSACAARSRAPKARPQRSSGGPTAAGRRSAARRSRRRPACPAAGPPRPSARRSSAAPSSRRRRSRAARRREEDHLRRKRRHLRPRPEPEQRQPHAREDAAALDAAGLADERGGAPHVRASAGRRRGGARRRPRRSSRGRRGRRSTSPTSRPAAAASGSSARSAAALAARAARGNGAGTGPPRRS